MASEKAHPALHELLAQLQGIYDSVSSFHPNSTRPPILDSSLSIAEAEDDGHPSHQDHIPGLKKLKESLKLDLDGLQKFLDDPDCANRPPPSTNAPYLISVWHELLCAPSPVISIFKMFLFEPKSDQPASGSSKAAMRRKNHGMRPPGAKVDVVANAGKVWIRVNTVKNSRLLAEFREIDSYLTESGEDSDWDDADRPTLAQAEFDNSILKMGRGLLQAAQANPIVEGTNQIPHVIMRLTRLDPTITDGPEADPRIAKTVQMLQEMGVEVQLGERSEEELSLANSRRVEEDNPPIIPSRRINLDLSVLIALVSEMTHAPLPKSVEEANKRFIPPKEYLDWKQTRRKQMNRPNATEDLEEEVMNVDDLPHYLATHSRALTHQLLGEMGQSMIQEIRDRIDEAWPDGIQDVEFWITTEARDRCLRIVSKIGALNEKRRAYALFCIDPSDPFCLCLQFWISFPFAHLRVVKPVYRTRIPTLVC
ncbi:hypothetical protein NMY22_g2248 [Coprinellus aureogranulatus]|nr:hypothetical protein NMY22_g2248 [Coprinellus aureogranulatus]